MSVASITFVVMASLFGLLWRVNSAYDRTVVLEARLNAVEAVARDNRTELSVMRADMREIETQFRASDQVRNLMHANELRVQALLWQKSFGQAYPTDNAYYPTIAKEPDADYSAR